MPRPPPLSWGQDPWLPIGGRDRTEDPTGEIAHRRGRDACPGSDPGCGPSSLRPLRVSSLSRDSALPLIAPRFDPLVSRAPPGPVLCSSWSSSFHQCKASPSWILDYPFCVEESPPPRLTTLLLLSHPWFLEGEIQTPGYIGKGRSWPLGVSLRQLLAASCFIAPRRTKLTDSTRARTHIAMAATACTMNLAMAKPARKTFQGNKGADGNDRRRGGGTRGTDR